MNVHTLSALRFNMQQEVIVVIGDVRGSRKMDTEERHAGQLFIKSTIVQLNEKFDGSIIAPFMITRGDEFQGVVQNMKTAFDIVLELERLLFPLNLRYGIGRGKIYSMGSTITIEMDGPAFHRASEALTRAKKKKRSILVNTGTEEKDALLNSIFVLINAIKSRWNEINYNRYWRYKTMGTFEKVAQYEKVSAQAIWDSMQNMRAIEVLQVEKTLENIFEKEDTNPQ